MGRVLVTYYSASGGTRGAAEGEVAGDRPGRAEPRDERERHRTAAVVFHESDHPGDARGEQPEDSTTEGEVSPHLTAPEEGGGLAFEEVAAAADRLEPAGVRRVCFDLLAKPPDVDVHRARSAIEVVAPQFIQNLLPGKDAARVLEEE